MPCPELKECPETPSVTLASSRLVSFPDPERARAKKGSGDNAMTFEGRDHVT